MSELYLTADTGKFLGPIATALGWIMDKIYIFFYKTFGIESIAFSIVIFTIFIYLCLFPLTYKQQKFSVLSKKMQPELNAIQKKYKGKKDQASMTAQQEETQAIYDKYGISPTGSCVQLVIQMPILFALYRVFYNIPAYLTHVKGVFMAEGNNLVEGIMSTDGYRKELAKLVKEYGIKNLKVDFGSKVSDAKVKNYIIDFTYRFGDSQWADFKANKTFSGLADQIDYVTAKLDKMNYIGKLCLSDTPLNIIKAGWANNHDIIIIICAALVPVLAYLTQVLNVKLSPASQGSGANDQMAQQMKTMNIMMPLMSLFICFSVPVGLGVYWIAGAVVRTIQQFFLNKHFDKIDLEDVIEKNKEKAAQKREKREAQRAMITQNATVSTKSMAEKAGLIDSNREKLESVAEDRANAPAGSMTAIANLVKDFNEKNNK